MSRGIVRPVWPGPGVRIGDGVEVIGGEAVPRLGDGTLIDGGIIRPDLGGWTLLRLADADDKATPTGPRAGRVSAMSQTESGVITATITDGPSDGFGPANSAVPARAPYWRWDIDPVPGFGPAGSLGEAGGLGLQVLIERVEGGGLWDEAPQPQVAVGAFAGDPEDGTTRNGGAVGYRRETDGSYRLVQLERASSSAAVAAATTSTLAAGRILGTATRSLGTTVVGITGAGAYAGPYRAREDDTAISADPWRILMTIGLVAGTDTGASSTLSWRAWYRAVTIPEIR